MFAGLDAPTRLRRCLNTFAPVQRTLSCVAASLFLELELRIQGLPSANSEEFGTYDHLCLVFERMGGHVERS